MTNLYYIFFVGRKSPEQISATYNSPDMEVARTPDLGRIIEEVFSHYARSGEKGEVHISFTPPYYARITEDGQRELTYELGESSQWWAADALGKLVRGEAQTAQPWQPQGGRMPLWSRPKKR